MFGHIPKGKRGRANTTLLNAWVKYLADLLKAKLNLHQLNSLSNASGIKVLNYNRHKNNLNKKVKEATAVVNHLRKQAYGH